jgi:hypothetical protein
MEQIHITLPDGSVKDVPKGSTAADVARSISPRLADAALVARVAQPNDGEGELIDLRRPLERDVKLQILTEKDPDALFVFRHSAAHLLAAAVMELYPNVKLGIGPPVDNGFFYEFLREEPFTQEDLAKIEKKMHELAAQDLPNERKLIPKPEALDLYKKSNQVFKCELVQEKAAESMVSFYTTGKFIDFCRGPHIPSTKRIQAFKLMNVAGAYWKGQEGNPQLQRIYAVAFFTQKELDEYLHRLEEAKRRDHRKLGVELDLFRGRTGADFLARERRADSKDCRRLAARRAAGARIRPGVHAAHHAARFVEDQRAHRLLQRQHVRPGGSGESGLPAEAHELPGAHPDLQIAAAQLPRFAGAAGRAGHRVPLRTERRPARAAARARVHARRRAHFLHAVAN